MFLVRAYHLLASPVSCTPIYLWPQLQSGDALAWTEYQRILRTANAVDYDDILFFARDLLHSSEGIRRRLQQEFKYILVDEYQDSNPIQVCILVGPLLRPPILCSPQVGVLEFSN